MTDEGLQPMARAQAWAKTMHGHPGSAESFGGVSSHVWAHSDTHASVRLSAAVTRLEREEREAATMSPGATLASGAGNRAVEEEPDPERTCFERDRDRVVHSTAFRRLAGKTQVVVFPRDHQRTRLTHALEVAQVAVSIAKGIGVNVALAAAIALAHDCGHGPGGHASEEAFDLFIPEGFDHAVWGADVALTSLNLCAETLDGVRNHSWSRPAPWTFEGEICSWADRIAYCAHDLEDALHAGIVKTGDLPAEIRDVVGTTRREQLGKFIRAVIATVVETGQVGMDAETANALAQLRAFNYERIYTRKDSLAQSRAMIEMLRALVEFYVSHPDDMPDDYRADDLVRGAVTYVSGMTDRFALEQAEVKLRWAAEKLPRGIGRGA